MRQDKNSDNKILDEILTSIHKINYGEVVITIHNSKIVQIERREKRRFDLRPTIKMEEKI